MSCGLATKQLANGTQNQIIVAGASTPGWETVGGDLTNVAGTFTVVAASTTVAGKIEIATQAEVDAGTDTSRAVTPDTLANTTLSFPPSGAAGGDLTGTYPNPTIADDAVDDAALRNSAAVSVIGRAANSVGDPADIAAGSNNTVLKRVSDTLSFATVVNADIDASAAIDTSKLADGADFIQRDGSVAFTADQSMGSNKLTNVTDPTSAQDAATKAYVDAVAQGLAPQNSVVVRAQGNINLSAPGATIDGVTMSVGDRFLADQQTTTTEDGVYEWQGAATPATRASDFATGTAVAGYFVFVEEGTDADSGYVCTNDGGSDVVGTDDLTFTKFTGLGQITAGTGLTKTGDTINAIAGNGIIVNADDIEVSFGLVGELVASGPGDSAAAGTTDKSARIDHQHKRETWTMEDITTEDKSTDGNLADTINNTVLVWIGLFLNGQLLIEGASGHYERSGQNIDWNAVTGCAIPLSSSDRLQAFYAYDA